MLLAVVAVERYSVSPLYAFIPVLLAFVAIGIVVFRPSKHGQAASSLASVSRNRTALMRLAIPFLIGAIYALIMALREGWNTGDTIGAIFVGVFALLALLELLRNKHSQQPK
jgi:TctA family transporter